MPQEHPIHFNGVINFSFSVNIEQERNEDDGRDYEETLKFNASLNDEYSGDNLYILLANLLRAQRLAKDSHYAQQNIVFQRSIVTLTINGKSEDYPIYDYDSFHKFVNASFAAAGLDMMQFPASIDCTPSSTQTCNDHEHRILLIRGSYGFKTSDGNDQVLKGVDIVDTEIDFSHAAKITEYGATNFKKELIQYRDDLQRALLRVRHFTDDDLEFDYLPELQSGTILVDRPAGTREFRVITVGDLKYFVSECTKMINHSLLALEMEQRITNKSALLFKSPVKPENEAEVDVQGPMADCVTALKRCFGLRV